MATPNRPRLLLILLANDLLDGGVVFWRRERWSPLPVHALIARDDATALALEAAAAAGVRAQEIVEASLVDVDRAHPQNLTRNLGFRGRLRASRPLIADQFAYALACGFDQIDLPEAVAARQPVAQWLAMRETVSHTYQRGYGERKILDARCGARAETV